MKNKYVMLDISGKVPFYEDALCKSLRLLDDIVLFTPYDNKNEYGAGYPTHSLIRLYNHKSQSVKRITKAIEGILNYFYMLIFLLFHRVSVLHFQWLPFIEYTNIEKYFLWLFRIVAPKTKMVLTQHNTYPHGSSEQQKIMYKKKFKEINKYFLKFVVHTESAKIALNGEFDIPFDKIKVIYHGIFVPDTMPEKKKISDKKNVLMFGIQSYYKGTDILVDAAAKLPKSILGKIHITIAGKADVELYEQKKSLADEIGIDWISKFLEDDELNQLIVDSDLLVFPYRTISQSGALLLALAFDKPIIVSKLPSFIETLEGFPEDAFVEVDSVDSLCNCIIKHIEGNINIRQEIERIKELQDKYSWNNSALKTRQLYKSFFS